MRAAGLPARIVIGYQGGEYNNWGGHYLVRQSDAHAWAEVWVDNNRWQREDPTAVVAPDRVSYGTEIYSALSADGALSDEARLERLNALNAPGWHWLVHHTLLAWDGLDQQWNLSVLGYDQDKQQTVFQKMGVDNLSWFWGVACTMTVVFSILAAGTAAMRLFHRGPARRDDPARRLVRALLPAGGHGGAVAPRGIGGPARLRPAGVGCIAGRSRGDPRRHRSLRRGAVCPRGPWHRRLWLRP